jgi:hypothetical protein
MRINHLRSFVPAFMATAATAAGCGSTGQEEISYPIQAQGRSPAPFMAGMWQVTLEVARVGFGPLYFCASASSSRDTCPTAVAEFAQGATVDAIDPQPQALGEVAALTAEVRSAIYGYAYIWPLTQNAPLPITGAPGGHSAHFEGTAVQGASTLRFVADVDVLPTFAGTLAVQGAAVVPTVQEAGLRLDVTFDPIAWWSQVDFNDLAAVGGDPVTVTSTSTSRAYNTLVIAMTSTDRPTLVWTEQ